ncbi:MAG: DmsC/YnfH family molybdoenzyme membrane anchor subunit [Planctomycetaceae bacterium]
MKTSPAVMPEPPDVAAHPQAPAEPGLLLAWLLNDQQELTAVESFSRARDGATLPAQSRYYSRLLPASPPGPGEQYAFEVDLDRCSGCKACVAACHALNGLDEGEAWRDVGLLIGGTSSNPYVQHVTTACHHCLQPACMIACPVDAYVKDDVTGIVRHLDDQCFGCQYCTLACPYDVPKYHSGKGIVRKCDMCSARLAVGEAPACVQACPHEAIAIRVVSKQQVIDDCEVGQFLPGAPDQHLTLPTTNFKTARALPRNAQPADYHQTSPQHPHWPLIVMLVLTQLSVGAFAAGRLTTVVFGSNAISLIAGGHAAVSLALGLLALAASLLHLGRPQYAFRALIGLRHSWLSREILAFSVFAAFATLYALWLWFKTAFDFVPAGVSEHLEDAVVISGLMAVGCSVMIYVSTRRDFWSAGNTAGRFLLTTSLLGTATLWVTASAIAGTEPPVRSVDGIDLHRVFCLSIIAISITKLMVEASALRWLWAPSMSSWKRSAQLHVGALSEITLARFGCGLLGGIVLPLIACTQSPASSEPLSRAVVIVASAGALLSGELLERYLFFAAVAAPRMPGAIRT